MGTLSQSTLRRRYARACRQLAAPAGRFPYRSQPAHDGSPHVEVSNDLYHYVVTERGTEFERRSTPDADQLLYWLLRDVAFNLACAFELEYRVAGKDPRRLLLSTILSSFGRFPPLWEERCAREIDHIPEEHPLDDN